MNETPALTGGRFASGRFICGEASHRHRVKVSQRSPGRTA